MNRDRLHLWQDRLARNDSQYENWYARMDERERLYQGSRYIFPLVNKYRPSNAKTPHVRNICSELIEAQVDSNIPSPKVTAVHEKDEPLAKIIEDMLRNEMDRLPFAEINDLMERIVPIQGGGAYLVEWDNTARTHTTIGELNVVPIHPRQMVPQDGVYSGIEDMDYIILKMPQTQEYIYRRYGKDVSFEGEAEPDIKGGDGSTAEDMVTQYIAYYRNDAGGIGMYSWCGDVELEDLEDYQARRLRRCAVCGQLEPTADDGDEKYLNDYNMLLSDLGVVQGQEASDYNKYLTDLNQYNTDRDFDYGAWLDRYNMLGNNLQAGLNMDAQELERYLAQLQQYNTDRDFYYGQLLDEINDQTNDFGTLVDMAQLAAGYGDYRGLENLGIQLPTPSGYAGVSTGEGAAGSELAGQNESGGMSASTFISQLNRIPGLTEENKVAMAIDARNNGRLSEAEFNRVLDKLNEGYSSEAAQNYATLVGASEGALQYLLGGIGALSKSGTGRIAAKIAGLDNALGRVARTVSGSTAARLLGSMISEGTEEGLQELLEPAFAAIIFDEEYEADFEDAAYAFLLGALSAGIIEGPAAIAYDEFKQQIGRAYESLRTVRQIALEQDAKRAELERLLEIAETGPTEGELDRVKRLWDEGKKARRAYERAVRRNLLSDRDRQLLGQLMRGEISAEDIPSTANRAGIAEIYAAKREYEAFAGALKEFNTKRRAALRAQADDILAGASRMKDKRRGASYMRETQERNARYVFDGPTAEKIIETYFTPVHKNEARRTVYKTQLRDRVRELDLDRKARKGDAVSEAAAVQIYGEALDNISMIEEQLKRGGSDWRNGHSLSEWRALVDDLWAKSPGLDKEKITAAVEEFRKIYDELFSLMNQVRIRNGYEPVDYRHGYFPHFDDAKGESLLGRAFKAADMKDVPLKDRLAALVGKGLDVNTEVNALPTSINGLTHTFKPGIRWVGNIMRRQGFDTTFDAVEGFDRYIEGVSDVIYHTDDIQRLRALASQIRYRTTGPGIQAQVDAIRADPSLSEDKKDTDVRAKLEEGKYELSNYVNNIEEYTNLLANKRSTMDRGVEQLIGRDYYNFAIALENRVAANMVAVNPGSWLTNFIPISQAWAEVSAGDILTSMRDTLSAMVKDDGFRTKSDFLTNRMGSDPLVLSWTQDASKVLTKPMEWIDMFTSETVVRARYNSNLKLGMSETAAMEEADSFAASLIADRSKGALPTIFESRNPFTKLFTQFQVEVNNQLSYLYRDLPRNLKERGKKSLAVALLKFMLGAWLYDELYEAIVGRRPALDPLNMLNEFSGDLVGYALPNTIELAVDMITGNDVSFKTEKTDAATALANFGKELGGQLPFIGGPVFDGGRLPMQSAIKDPLAYLLLPFGGGQLSKFVKGVNAVAEGGVYGKDAEGNPTLKYPVERNVQDALTAMVFGTTSTKGGQEWIDRGFSRLTAKQTAAYAALLGGGIDAYDAFDVVMDIKGTEKTETQSANDIKREKISALDISDELKATLYSNLITDDYDEAIDDMLRRGVDWDGIMGVVTNSKYGVERYNKLVDAGVSPGNAARITEALYSLEPEDGKKSVSQVQQYGAIDKLDGLTDEEKLAAIGTIMGTDATTESGNPSQYSKLTDAIESGLSLTDALEQRENGTLDDYLEFYSAGMKSDAAVDAAETLDAMPEDASTVERYLAIAEMPLSERDKDAALSAIMSDSAYEKYQAARSKGIDTYEYVAFLRAISDFSGDGKQQRVWDYINSLPLSTAQKDQLHYAAGYKESSLAKTPWH